MKLILIFISILIGVLLGTSIDGDDAKTLIFLNKDNLIELNTYTFLFLLIIVVFFLIVFFNFLLSINKIRLFFITLKNKQVMAKLDKKLEKKAQQQQNFLKISLLAYFSEDYQKLSNINFNNDQLVIQKITILKHKLIYSQDIKKLNLKEIIDDLKKTNDYQGYQLEITILEILYATKLKNLVNEDEQSKLIKKFFINIRNKQTNYYLKVLLDFCLVYPKILDILIDSFHSLQINKMTTQDLLKFLDLTYKAMIFNKKYSNEFLVKFWKKLPKEKKQIDLVKILVKNKLELRDYSLTKQAKIN